MTTMRLSLLLALLLGGAATFGAIIAAGPAAAQGDGRPGTAEQRRACTPDVDRLCAAEIPSVSGITNCLRRRKESLSPGCRAVFEK